MMRAKTADRSAARGSHALEGGPCRCRISHLDVQNNCVTEVFGTDFPTAFVGK
jgi:hypothetical protein